MRQLTAGFLSLTALLGLTIPVQAQEMAAPPVTPSCNAALATAQKRIETGGEIEVRVHRSDVSASYTDYPLNRPAEYTFAFQGTAELTIINSPKFMTALATDVVQACETVSLVTFTVAGTDYMHLLGLMPGGEVKAFDCLEITGNTEERPTWTSGRIHAESYGFDASGNLELSM